MPEAYARLILDVIRGDHAQFVRSDELAAAWAIFSPLLHRIETERVPPLIYPFGSRGPPAADDLVRRCGCVVDLRPGALPSPSPTATVSFQCRASHPFVGLRAPLPLGMSTTTGTL